MKDKKNAHNPQNSLDSNYTSGFTKAIDTELNATDIMPIEKGYSNIQEHYVSSSGPTRLFTATKYGKRYILKCLKEDYLYVTMYKQTIVKEFEIGLQLEHPNICHTFAMERLAGLGYTIVMEYVDGETLQTLIDEKRLSTELATKIVSQLMNALSYMHSKQIIHRDIKPSNIMVTHTGKNVKIIDFGLSDSDSFNVLKMPAGTYRYIAPEQLLPNAVAEPMADIYSLGMVIEDMAIATGSKKLKRMAKTCIEKDTSLRPNSIEALRKYLAKDLRDLHTLSFLCMLVAILTCIVIVSFIIRCKDSVTKENCINQTDNNQTSSQDDNKIIDYGQWKNK